MRRKGQYTAELVLLLSLVLAAIIGMQAYVRRGMNVRWKGAIDTGVDLAQQALPDVELAYDMAPDHTIDDHSILMQYEPYYTDEEVETEMKHSSKEENSRIEDEDRGMMSRESFMTSTLDSKSASNFDRSTDAIW